MKFNTIGYPFAPVFDLMKEANWAALLKPSRILPGRFVIFKIG
ncbi:hypothetical protein [Mucilaginibacter boryungensis]|nr:hypothetical protein [Mucilaginibacter boryungensis]